jgi:hypothetical protein
MKLIDSITPRISRRYLLFVAAFIWTMAGGILLFRGMLMFRNTRLYYWPRLIMSGLGGIVFYLILFSRISRKHTVRILNLPYERPCLFSFFNLRSYILMSVMITAGITLRKTGLISPVYLSVVYVTMGIPLFISAFRFYYTGILTIRGKSVFPGPEARDQQMG